MTFVYSMVLKGDASDAKAALQETGRAAKATSAEVTKVGTAGREASTGVTATGTAAAQTAANLRTMESAANEAGTMLDRAKAEFDALRLSLDSGFAGATRYAEVQRQVAQAVQAGAASQTAANVVLEQARSRYLGVATAAEQAAAKQMAFARQISDLKALRIGLDDVYAASMQYEQALQMVNAGVASGAITQTEANRLLSLAEQRYLAVAAAETQMGTAATAAASKVQALNTSNRGAAAQMANLGAQFNDIGIMMMAGQNPLQLAVQQGTQITQVIGPMGAAGAAKALGAAFLSLISPVNLVTIGAIAAAAAFTNWLMSSGEEAKTLGDQLDDLSHSVDAVQAATRDALTPMYQLEAEFGRNAKAARDAYDALLAIKQMNFADEMVKAQEALGKTFSGIMANLKTYEQATANAAKATQDLKGHFLETAVIARGQVQDAFNGTIEQTRTIRTALDALGNAQGPQQITEAAKNLLHAIQATADSSGRIPEQLRPAAEAAARLELSAASMAGSLGRSADEARALVQVDIAGNLESAADASWRMAQELGHALSFAQGLAGVQLPGVSGQPGGTGGLTFKRSPWTLGTPANEAQAPATTADGWSLGATVPGSEPTKTTRRGGLTDTERQQKAVTELITAEQTRLAVLRETDPVEQEMLQNSRQLTGATDAQRQAVRTLITERIASQKQLEAETQQWDFFGQVGLDAFDGLIAQGQSLDDVMSNLANSILEAALKAELLGTGPLASLLGTSPETSVMSGILGAFGIQAHASGGPIVTPGRGYVTGPGSGTSDDVLMWGSAGEFMMNARATAQYRPMLEAMNAGVPAFAEGGMIGGGSSGGAGGFVVNAQPIINIENYSSAQVRQEEGTDSAGRRTTTLILSDAVGQGMNARGGLARKTLHKTYGLSPVKAKR
ncbi:phage tail length tape measure family protein [Acidimangrovimonas sediminis]|uniref:phage tail length tape measure family protein n=1 Tax=Acidimangrovimonas sediminis TaxID=2056283 RepID=UPI000C803C39|nr:phage tail length tape measure family protein [Acidimangrovimonas sediminis]